ncbi:hypothetical protein LLE49_17010 [Alicyclobacillus tolerans]|uniref:hypothetical protein n=1 Tax=Alicyclobacillus tolerans TaxID=90970 RepID=UPI001F3C81E5|nr:hypothetical protein [Alicyclobacillus tolerans]MCF8566424.1 hypothetical protein [Alicyclobacillus tolerans]
MLVHDNAFNANEWSVIIGLCIGLLLVFALPKRFPTKASFVFFMCGVYSGFFFDNSLTIQPFDFYDVNDTGSYEVVDYLLYLAYGPVSYLFFYVWGYMGFRYQMVPLYALFWAFLALGLEQIGAWIGVFHYLHGYRIQYSMPIYLVVFCLWMVLYRYYQALSNNGQSRL